eukprot:3493738-Alexandrium_andersonii.AAC.1
MPRRERAVRAGPRRACHSERGQELGDVRRQPRRPIRRGPRAVLGAGADPLPGPRPGERAGEALRIAQGRAAKGRRAEVQQALLCRLLRGGLGRA